MIPGAKGRICRQHGATNRRTTALPSGAPGAISATKALRVGPPGAWQHPAAPKRAGAMIGAPDGGSGGFLKDGIARVLGRYGDPGQMDTMELWLFVASAILVAGSLAILGWSLAPQLWP